MTHRDAIDFALWTMSKNSYGNITKQEALVCQEGYCLCFPTSAMPHFSVDVDLTEPDACVYFTLYMPSYDEDNNPDYEAYDAYSTYDLWEAHDMFVDIYNDYLIDRRCDRWAL